MTTISIAEYLGRQKRTIDKIVDQTYFRLMEDVGVMEEQLPRTNYDDRTLLALKMDHGRPTVASLVAEEQEIPVSRQRLSLSEDLMGNLKIGKQHVWKARDFEAMRKLQLMVASGETTAAVSQGLQKYFFGQVADLVPAVFEKALVLTMKVATTGSCIFTDPLSGAKVELTYPTVAAHLPAALAAAARWSQPTTCTPLQNLADHAQTIKDTLGYWMTRLTLRDLNFRQIANSNEAKIAYLRKIGSSLDTSIADNLAGIYLEDQQVIDLIKSRTRVEEVVIFDAQYSEEQADGTILDKPFLDDNYYFFGKPGFIEQAFVPTVEKDFQPGIYSNSRVLNDAPRVERSVAVGNMVPACFDPRCIAARKVA